MTELSEQEVAQKVRQYVQDCHPGGITLEVVEPGIRREEHWWQVPLRPSAWPEKMFEFYEALADVEEALEEHEQLKVLLVSGEPAVSSAA
jgi:hypothetical protein